jgi:hypothetical protein
MTNLPNTFRYPVQATTQAHPEKRFKSTTDEPSAPRSDETLAVRSPFPIWQITVPLCIVLIFAIGSLTAYSMVEGRYLFDLTVSREQIRIRTDVDKREGSSTEDGEGVEGNHGK